MFQFENFYSFIKAYKNECYNDAIRVLSEAKDDLICKYLSLFFERYSDNEISESRNDPGLIKIWSRTSIARKEYLFLLEVYKNILNDDNAKYYFDIGCGNAKYSVLLLEKYKNFFNGKKIVLVDKNSTVIKDAYGNVKNASPSYENIIPVVRDIIDLDINRYLPLKESAIINAGSVLHEFPEVIKREVISKLISKRSKILISELCIDHETKIERDLALNSYIFYSYLLNDVLSSNLAKCDAEKFIIDYLMDELLTINIALYEQRNNYHMKISQWISLFEDLGLKYSVYTKIFDDNAPEFSVFYLRS